MPDGRKKVFISWSKAQSKQVANVLSEYLPEILEGVDVFMSSKDIDPGERSMKTIETQLDGTSYGVLVVTAENQSEPWLNFEAGALSKNVGRDDEDVPRVVPLLVDIPNALQLTGPISQFQAVQLDKAGIKSIVVAVTKLTANEPAVALKRFNRAWPDLEKALAAGRQRRTTPRKNDRSIEDQVGEALEILRSLQRTMPSLIEAIALGEAPPNMIDLERQLEMQYRRNVERAVELAKDLAPAFGAQFVDAHISGNRLMRVVVEELNDLNLQAFTKELSRRLGRNVQVIVQETIEDNDDLDARPANRKAPLT